MSSSRSSSGSVMALQRTRTIRQRSMSSGTRPEYRATRGGTMYGGASRSSANRRLSRMESGWKVPTDHVSCEYLAICASMQQRCRQESGRSGISKMLSRNLAGSGTLSGRCSHDVQSKQRSDQPATRQRK
ncbi:hypothetical protein DOTSEDRAFT_71661 [Dothistroma septosporum NZE10]|uniref:Uncharacterized protein n=1 Tax=Dothistroma septosporum (strain NZE10 / CBS 128990) TaxID=675120 RepID=N1PKP7_DOTSN|nr:hypothetical protein DOTSEDRAFT_71661 [Dothistroma septosporum NZE10]